MEKTNDIFSIVDRQRCFLCQQSAESLLEFPEIKVCFDSFDDNSSD